MAHSLDAIFRPRSVAVIGASINKSSLGRVIFEKLLASDFNGPVYPVNPKANYIHSVKAYPRISEVPDQVDLAILVVRKEFVLEVVKECADSGVKGVVVITAGFKETGAKGAAAEREIVDVIRKHNMRMVGPNCMGVINAEPSVRLDGTFSTMISSWGNLAMVSQSGALGQTILEHASELNLGVSMFVSVGNKADVSGNDLLEYWRDDDNVEVVLMYLESFGNPDKFVRLAKEVSLKKPIVVVKSGRTRSGARAATSHTGALAGMDMAFDALFKQCGVIRADTINQMFDFAMGFANLPLPKGDGVAIITNAGGPGILAADACENFGLRVVDLSEETSAGLRARLVAEASVGNPVDLLAGAQPEEFRFALDLVLRDTNVDAAIVIFVAPIITDPTEVARKISEEAQRFDKPVLGCFMGVKGVAPGVAELQKLRVPAFPFPEPAARTLAAMVSYSRWLRKGIGHTRSFKTRQDQAQTLIQTALGQKREYLGFEEISELLSGYGIPLIKSAICQDWQAVRAASRVTGYPAVLKIASETIIHKSEVGGVKLGLRSEQELKRAYDEITVALREQGLDKEPMSFVLQEMVEGGREVIMGIHAVPGFGSLIMFGLGGIYVEVLHDVVFRIAPLTNQDAAEMIREIKAFPILQGVRGDAGISLDFLEEVLLRLSQLAVENPQIQEMDMNPFLLFPEREKCRVVDARVRVVAQNGRSRQP